MNGDVPFNPLGEQINVNHIDWLVETVEQNYFGQESNYLPFQSLHLPVWSDEPSWSKYHASCWNALRTGTWTNMPFSPKRLGDPQRFADPHGLNRKSFVQLASAYSALADVMAFGDEWGTTIRRLNDWHIGKIAPRQLDFVKFWYPMLNTYGDWLARYGLFGWPKILNELELPIDGYKIDPNRGWPDSFDETRSISETFLGDKDPLHLSMHSGKPLNVGIAPRIDVNFIHSPFGGGWMEAPPYGILTSDSYEGWARSLREMEVRYSTLIRVDIQIHESMQSLTTLGHFLVNPGDIEGLPEGSNNIRFINDNSLLSYLQHGHFNF